MSMRQQILYIMQMSEQNQNWDNDGKFISQNFSFSFHFLTFFLFFYPKLDEVSTNNFNEKFEIARFKMVTKIFLLRIHIFSTNPIFRVYFAERKRFTRKEIEMAHAGCKYVRICAN